MITPHVVLRIYFHNDIIAQNYYGSYTEKYIPPRLSSISRTLRREKDVPFESRCATEHEISVHTKSCRTGAKGREALHGGRDDKANLRKGEGNRGKVLAR